MARLTRQARRRRYIQASLNAGLTGLPAEHRQAAEGLMRGHERAYPGVREHAMAATNRDLDKPLTAGEREHQQAMRDQAGLQEADLHRIRQEMRETSGSERSQTLAGPRAARRAATAAAGPIGAVLGGGNTLMYLIGTGLLLALLYLLVAGKGPQAAIGVANVLTSAVGAFVRPVDPIAAAQKALGAGSSTSTSTSAGGSGANTAGAAGGSSAFAVPSPTAKPFPETHGEKKVAKFIAHGGEASKPGAQRLTWGSLRRQIKAGKLSKAQVTADLRILQGAH